MCVAPAITTNKRTYSMMCYTEISLTDDVRDLHVNVECFSLFRSDRTKDSEKLNGGGVCLFLNEKWCQWNSMSVKHKVFHRTLSC